MGEGREGGGEGGIGYALVREGKGVSWVLIRGGGEGGRGRAYG